MLKIDADAHVVENEHTWDYMDPSDSQFRPYELVPKDPNVKRGNVWVVEGRIVRGSRSAVTEEERARAYEAVGRKVATPQGAAEGEDVQARLSHMDELGIDVQVLHSTLFIHQVTHRPEVDVALCRGYNRWMADIWRQSGGRLRWVAVTPLTAMDEAITQLRTAVQNGACGVNIRPIEGDRMPYDPYFFPIYEEAERQNVPVAMHIGNANPYIHALFNTPKGGSAFSLRVVTALAFHSLVFSEVPLLFPKLRWAFLESTAEWLPWVLKDLRRRFPTQHQTHKLLGDDVMEDYNLYVACESTDDLAYILRHAGGDHLMVGSDYGHTDQASELDVLMNLGKRTGIDDAVMAKILGENPARAYNIV